ncbi:T9SS type B sorting domain-containing protein [Flavobacterium sp. DGU11]|uniref:T9SS type B sorting domain-containing protein n=1 Tax=Flavobacterium arundinis TaxID=3139143 RepID=A0ABU9HVB0_9FLAO
MKFTLTILTLLFFLTASGQNDCSDALIVCGNMGYDGLTANGPGRQELNNSNTCQSFENNSIWLELHIKTGGTLGFTITPGNPDINVDFDFFIFGPNVTCGNIGQAIRCSTTNPEFAGSASNLTGMNDSETDTAEGPGELGNNFIRWLTVQDGESYFLVIDRPIGASDFSIQWTGTASFHDTPVFNNPDSISLDLKQCDDDGIDDKISLFDLTTHQAMLLDTQTDVALTFYENQNDVITGSNPITSPGAYANTSALQTIYTRMTNSITGCFNSTAFTIEVINPIVAGQPVDLYLCDFNEDGKQEFTLSQNDTAIKDGGLNMMVTYYSTLEDADNKTNPIPALYTNEVPYTAETIWARLENISGCFGYDVVSFTINIIPLPEIVYKLDIVDFRDSENAITVVMPDPESYEFSIDGGGFSDSFVFENLEAGPHVVFIRAKTGCKTIHENVVILNYPKYFSPNGDGLHDTWRIPYLSLHPQASVTIFDRYGKVIDGFRGENPGWDGNLNGKALPSTDYWFVLELENGRKIQGHFAMLR